MNQPSIIQRNSVRRNGGFTIVEVLIAAAVGALLMGALYDMFYTGSRINRDTQNRADALQAASLTLASIQQDLKQLITLPVNRDSEGKPINRFGDHQVPVRISPLGRNITFYVPDGGTGELPSPSAVAVTYGLEQANTGGLFRVKRTERRGDEDEDVSGRVLSTVNVRGMRFRLLAPNAIREDEKSPDSNFYVETVVTGSDATGLTTMTLASLTQLDYPSTFQQTRNRNVNETLAFQPRAPLPNVPDQRSYTQEEFDALQQLRDLAEQFQRGEVGVDELEPQVRKVVEIADRQPGRKDVVATQGVVGLPPLGDTPLTLQPGSPGRPIEFQTPGGDSVIVPTNRDEINNRILEEIARQGAGGGGNIRITMTDTFAEFSPGSDGNLQRTNIQGTSREGNVSFESDAGTDFDAVHDAAVASFRGPTSKFFGSYGLPPPSF